MPTNRTPWRKLALLSPLLLVVLVFAALNADYIRIQITYALNGPAAVIGPGTILTVPGAPTTSTSNLLTIPSLGIQAPIQYAIKKDEASIQNALLNGVVHYPGTANPGQPGNVYIVGHSSDYRWSAGKYKTVLALLPKIKEGDEMQVTDKAGKIYRYRVIETKIVNPTDLSVLSQGDGSKKLLTVQTSYPIGTALRRFLAIGELVTD
jgi:sortase A